MSYRLNTKTIFDLYEDEIDKAYDNRKARKDKFIALVNVKIDKLTDETLDKFIEYFEDLK
jgi:hypothetical protein